MESFIVYIVQRFGCNLIMLPDDVVIPTVVCGH